MRPRARSGLCHPQPPRGPPQVSPGLSRFPAPCRGSIAGLPSHPGAHTPAAGRPFSSEKDASVSAARPAQRSPQPLLGSREMQSRVGWLGGA